MAEKTKSPRRAPETGSNAPKTVVSVGPIKLAIWTNQTDGKREWHSLKLTKEYASGDGDDLEWKQTEHLNKDDIPKAIEALTRAYGMMCETRIVRFDEDETKVLSLNVAGETSKVIKNDPNPAVS